MSYSCLVLSSLVLSPPLTTVSNPPTPSSLAIHDSAAALAPVCSIAHRTISFHRLRPPRLSFNPCTPFSTFLDPFHPAGRPAHLALRLPACLPVPWLLACVFDAPNERSQPPCSVFRIPLPPIHNATDPPSDAPSALCPALRPLGHTMPVLKLVKLVDGERCCRPCTWVGAGAACCQSANGAPSLQCPAHHSSTLRRA